MMHWTEEQKAFVREHAPGRPRKETYQMFLEAFDVDLEYENFISFMKRSGIRNGLDTTFKKGNAPWSKGIKMPPEAVAKTRKTQFKKGHTPHNILPVGTEMVLHDGYVWVKLNDLPCVKKQVNWRQKHRLVWEEHHGPIPEGMYVSFLDGDRTNCNIENLILLSQGENSTLNMSGMRSKDPEVTKAAALLAKITHKVRERERE